MSFRRTEIDQRRVFKLNDIPLSPTGPVVYWMSRDQRAQDNWALLYAQSIAREHDLNLLVVFNLTPKFLDARPHHFQFMIQGLEKVKEDLHKKKISFIVTEGNPKHSIPTFLEHYRACMLITDFSPLKISRKWKEEVLGEIQIPFHEVDAHNIVPCFIASNKQEFAAYTFRPKINNLLKEFLTPYPLIKDNEQEFSTNTGSLKELIKSANYQDSSYNFGWIKPGHEEAKKNLNHFINTKLDKYNELRNDPTEYYSSNMSPFLHFGHISSQEIVNIVSKSHSGEEVKSFFEELIVRKELADNYCYFNKDYDNQRGFPDWAIKSLDKHLGDKRPFLYSLEQLELAQTHDDLWNCAQKEMMYLGKMHGYLRMYWAKKILEWSKNYEDAQKFAIYLNDKYELDGRDPNGYTGIAWSIGGVHDRPWFEREIFGQIRYMNYEGCKRKFDIKKYIQLVNQRILNLK